VTPDIGIEETSRSHSSRAREAGRSSRWTVLPAVAVGALAGFVAANLLARPPAALAAREASAPHAATAWISMARRLGEPGADRALQGALAQALASDTPLFRTIVEEYGRTEERPFRATLRDLIVASARPDVSGAGTELAHDARGLQRGAGFELLARLRPTPEQYAMAMRAVFEDTDPTALAGALIALRSPGLPSNADARQLLPRFIVLTHYPDPLVRGHAIQQLSDWDKSGEQATPIVLDAISDPDRLVREAAVGAVMIGELRSERLKGALLRTAGNAGEDPMLRGSALQALDRFPLTDAEQAQFRAGQDELERLAKALEKNHTQER
jgi:HEAT repeats